MIDHPLISVIIPTYNRAHLIGETLDSVIEQTYPHWECIVVDDGSTDHTDALLTNYCDEDARIKYYKRPPNLLKGANTCRNYGLELSKGTYINWFDSDDIMLPNFLELKMECVHKHPELDFVISRGINFYEDGKTEELPIRYNKTKMLDHNNFVLFEVFWVTPDFLVKKNRVGTVRFDETIQSGQEYNFFVKLLAINDLNGTFLDEILFKRRWHEQSIQGKFDGDDNNYCLDLYMLYKKTFKDVGHLLNREARQHMFRRIASRSFELRRRKLLTPDLPEVLKLYRREKGVFKTVIFRLSLLSAYYLGKGFKLMDISRK